MIICPIKNCIYKNGDCFKCGFNGGDIMTTPDSVINIAIAEVGYLEKSKGAYQLDQSVIYRKTDGAGSDNITKYGYEMHKVYPVTMDEFSYWCDSFVDWCFYKAYGVATARSLLCEQFDDYTVASSKMYKKHNAWYDAKSEPLPGDQIFFKNSQRICHTGLVYKVDKNKIYTVEGNTSNSSGVVPNGGCVAKKFYTKGYKNIAGFGRPKYDVPATTMFGDCNGNVYRAQKSLIAKGYKLPKYGADGDFGNETLNAIKQFQLDNHYTQTGIIDPNTWFMLL